MYSYSDDRIMNSDNEYLPRRSMSAEAPLPTPSDTPYHTPRLMGSRLSSYGTISPLTPPPLPPDESFKSMSHANGDKESNYDPEQFTSNLHASLVSEILHIRRDLESKNNLVDDLEAQLSAAKNETESLQHLLKRSGKESRALKRELQLHEDGSLSAVETLARERDEVNASNMELRRKIDISQKRYRAQDDENRRLATTLEDESVRWTNEKRVLERKASLAQSRLQTVVEELAAREAAPAAYGASKSAGNVPATSREIAEVDQDDLRSIHSQESKSGGHLRFKDSIGSIRGLQQNLATELEASVIEDGERSPSEDSEADMSDPEAEKHTTQGKRLSQKISGIVSTFEGMSDEKRDSTGAQELRRGSPKSFRNSVMSTSTDEPTSPRDKAGNVLAPSSKEILGDDTNIDGNQTSTGEVEANQRRKRDPPLSRPKYRHPRANSDPSPILKVIAQGFKESVPTQPASDASFASTETAEPVLDNPVVEVAAASTQTEPLEITETGTTKELIPEVPPPPSRPAPPIPGLVPTIAIHPPESNPSSPNGIESPSGGKDVRCQVALPPMCMRSTATQTEAIRIDRRSIKLPAHLLPSSLPGASLIRPKPEQKGKGHVSEHQDQTLPPPLPPLEEFSDTVDVEKEVDSALPLRSRKSAPAIPPRSTSHAGADPDLEDELEELELSDFEDSSLSLCRPSHRAQKSSRPTFEPPEPVPENEKFVIGPSKPGKIRRSLESRASQEKPRRGSKFFGQMEPVPSRHTSLPRNSVSVRSRSPSFGSAASSSNYSKSSGPRPPFAIPTRRSSKEASQPDARGNSSRSSPTRRSARLAKKAGSLRKARSAAAVADPGRPSSREVKDTPAPFSFEIVPQYPPRAALPRKVNKARGPKRTDPSLSNHLHDMSALFPTGNASVGSSVQHTVVDAMTATMIGEWMWKYIRKRKSFGVTETLAQPGKTSDARHKRWVWLSPYERTIMWSNKQPTSNLALMGKAGRKVPIQSVLDVKDETAPPKGAAGLIFSRSILVLTPARAVKFTAGSRERHYMWLTALSFLSQPNSTNNPRLSTLLPPAPPASSVPESESSGRRSRASSFLRSTKKSVASQQSSGHATPTAQQHEANALRHLPNAQLPDTAFAPTIPRLPHRRKRSATGPSSGRPSFARQPGTAVTSSNNSLLSGGNSSARLQPQSRASSARSFRPPELDVEPAIPNMSLRFAEESSPRQSMVSADFGGNSRFFDAVGVVRMDAFMKPSTNGGGPRGDVAPAGPSQSFASAATQRQSRRDGRRDSFNGPPDISRHRSPRRLEGDIPQSNEKSKPPVFHGF